MKAIALFRHLAITDPESLVDVTLPDDEAYYADDIRRPGSNSELHFDDERIVHSNRRRWTSRRLPRPR